jgi:hypothetical protein
MLREGSVEVDASWCGVGGSDAHDEKCARLHRRLKRIVKARGALDMQEAAALRDAEALRVWRHYGYSSLLEYMEMEMGYSPRMALERLRVAKAIVELPVIAHKMEQGDLSFSAARELTRVATPETEEQWVEAAADKTSHQIEELVSGHEPGDKPTDPVDPRLRTCRLRYLDIDPETKALLRQARTIIERELGDRVDDNTFLRTLARSIVDVHSESGRTKPPYQIAVTTCDQCKRGWQDGGGISVEMSPATFEVAQCDAQQIGRVDEPGDQAVSSSGAASSAEQVPTRGKRALSKSATHRATDHATHRATDRATDRAPHRATHRATSDIPPSVRRAVHARDHGKCRVPWCRSSRNIDQHHLIPKSDGGAHTLDNLILLCESHHIAHHEGALIIEGSAANARFTRRAHNSFAIAERALDTARALKELGFDRHEVKAAIDKTRTHVGTSELTLQHWIKIALSYCPRPTA